MRARAPARCVTIQSRSRPHWVVAPCPVGRCTAPHAAALHPRHRAARNPDPVMHARQSACHVHGAPIAAFRARRGRRLE
eukprot:6708400-Prymnesium_polylepis.2